MKYLITGGAGLIGSQLTKRLLDGGDEVICLDNFSTGCMENVEDYRLVWPNAFQIVVGSVTDSYIVNQLVKRCDSIIHLASVVGVYNVTNNSVKAIESNVIGDQNVLSAASAYNKGIVIASTSEIFGRSSDEDAFETSDMHIGSPYNSRWSYAAVKAINEWLVMGYHKEQNLPTMILRFFNVVGPNQSIKSGLVIPMMIKKAIRNEPIEIFGDGTQVRCFMHIRDASYIVQSLLRFMQTGFSNGEIYNVGNPFNEITIYGLAKLILEVTNSKSEIIYRQYNEVYPPGFQELNRRIPNMTKTLNAVRVGGDFVLQRDIGDIVSDMAIQIESRMI